MKRYVMSLCTTLMITIPALAQIKSEKTLGDFNAIKVKNNLDVTISQGDANTVSLETESQNKMDALKTEIVDGSLVISSEKRGAGDAKVHVTFKSIKTLEANGSGDVRSTGPVKAEELTVRCSGTGDIHLESVTQKINAEVSGTGDLILTGSTELLSANLSGTGDLKASKLEANKVVVNASGTGDARVNVKQNLHANVSGTGDVVYQEEPVEKGIEITGPGEVRKAHSKNSSDRETSDTTKFSFGHHKVIICDGEEDEKEQKKSNERDQSSHFKHWSGVEVGVNGLRSSLKDGVTLPKGAEYLQLDYSKSLSFSVNVIEHDFHLYQNYVNLVTGLGFEFNHYALQNNVTLRYDTSYTAARTEPGTKFKKNNLNESLLTVPLMLDFNTSTNPERNFHIAVGVIGAWKIGSRTRQEYTDSDARDVKVVKNNDYNLSPFRYSLIARMGFGRLSIFAQYGMSELFKSEKGPQVYPVSAGIGLHL
jgi:hypothetical protein